MHRDLQNAGIDSVIAPTPRSASLCCGVCLRIMKEDFQNLEHYLQKNKAVYREIKEIQENLNPKRDAYL